MVLGAAAFVLVGVSGPVKADVTGSIKLIANGKTVGQGKIVRGKEVAQNAYAYKGWMSTPNGKMNLFGARTNKKNYACFGWSAKGNKTVRVSVFSIVAKKHLRLVQYAPGSGMRHDGYGPRKRFVGTHTFGIASTETRMTGGSETPTKYTIKKLSARRYAITGGGKTALGLQVGRKLICAASGTGPDQGVAAIKFGPRGPTEIVLTTLRDKSVIQLKLSR